MSTRPTKPTTPKQSPPATPVQPQVETPRPEAKLPIVLRTDVGFEYNLELYQSIIDDILDPTTPNVFIEVPCPLRGGFRRFLHTAFIKEIDVRGLE